MKNHPFVQRSALTAFYAAMGAFTAFLITVLVLGFVTTRDVYAESWDGVDTFLGVTTTAALVADWGQTRYMAQHPAEFKEKNRILGEHPSVGRVNVYFATYVIGALLVADWLAPDNRKLFLCVISVVELSAVRHNRSIGVKFSF